MKFKFLRVLIAATAVTSFAGSMAFAAAVPVGPSVAASSVEGATGLWFVELTNAPSVNGTSQKALQDEKKAFRDAAQQAGVNYQERMAFDTLWNGFSVQASRSEISKIRSLPGVVSVRPVNVIPAPPKGGTASPDLFTALNMTGAATVQSELGFTGKGVKVAVVDTGIDIDHPAFGGDGVANHPSPLFPSARVPYGYDFVGDAYNADPTSPSYNPVPHPGPNPDDCAGHGTHVAGIVGANDPTNGLKGVAPDVTFGAYRVFGCEGSTSDDIIIAAMERAYKDGMQVLNMSLGSPFDWPQSPTAVAASRLVEKGMVVVASIGNSGANGLYSAGSPGLGEKVIGVASYDNTDVYLPYLTVNGRNIGYITMTYSPNPPTSGSFEVTSVGLACSALAAGSLSGKVALATRGTCAFAVKATNAINAGAKAVLISNNVAGVFNGTLGAPLDGVTPVVGISLADGNFIRTQQAPINMTWTANKGSFPSPTGGLISSFSSYGLSPDLALKPDIGAPGGNIYSSYPLELGRYASLSGTSMSSPHVAGAAALFLQAHPATKATDMRTYLQNSAVPKNWQGDPGLGFLDQVSRQGAGMLQIDKAILATAGVTPGKLALGESQSGPATRTLTITNGGSSPVTYTLSSVEALSVANTFSPAAYGSDATVAFSAPTVTVPPGKSANVTATITPPTGPDKAQYGGYIVLSGDNGTKLRVPFAGFVGDYQSIQALTPTPYGFPWLAVLYLGNLYQVTGPQDWVYSLVGDDVPYFLIHFDHQVQQLQAIILDAKTRAPVHPVFNKFLVDSYLPRNSTSTGFFAFAWDGTRMQSNGNHNMTKPVPNGQYVIVIKALKANGNPANPAHWETWTSPVVAIQRP